jgi:hypothetical protein
MKDARTKIRDLLAERILVLDGAWGVVHGGTHGSPMNPLLHRTAEDGPVPGLSPGKARLRPCDQCAGEAV